MLLPTMRPLLIYSSVEIVHVFPEGTVEVPCFLPLVFKQILIVYFFMFLTLADHYFSDGI